MKSWLLSTCLVACAVFGFAADIKYPVSAIPEDLKKGVDAVVREDRSVYRIISKSKARLSVYYAITIFNEKASEYAHRIVFYDKLTKISDFNAAAYDANGKQIKKLKNNEIYDQSAYDASTLFSDDRLKAVDMTQVTYPYTVVFEYEKEYNFLFGVEGSRVIPGEKVSVQKFSYQVIYPAAIAPRYKTANVQNEPVKSKTSDGDEVLTWSLENVLPVIAEPYSPPGEFFPRIIHAPSTFEFDGYAGNMSSWTDFGKWIQLLNKGRNVLPENTRETIRKITANASTPEEKIKILYEYMQGRTRYVGIQLGIGGFQPFEASVVDQTGYGDCKALSNYMVSMLEVIGIKANYALIGSGEHFPDLDPTFPSSQFNHAIVAVPNKKDTIWLECTSQTNPFGYQGTHTGNKKALLITDQGAAIVNTTKYTAEQNVQSRNAEIFVDATGDAKAKVITRYSGQRYEYAGLQSVLGSGYDEQKKWIQSTTKIPTFDINSFSMVNQKDRIPSAVVTLDLSLRKYAQVSGKRLFITPNLMSRSNFIPEKVENRKSNVVNRSDFATCDTILYRLPDGIYPEFLPSPVKLSTNFGEYEASFKLDEKGLIYTRKLRMKRGTFPAESYNELIEFHKNINKADNTKVVFLSKT
jgi:hypothetical protein